MAQDAIESISLVEQITNKTISNIEKYEEFDKDTVDRLKQFVTQEGFHKPTELIKILKPPSDEDLNEDS